MFNDISFEQQIYNNKGGFFVKLKHRESWL